MSKRSKAGRPLVGLTAALVLGGLCVTAPVTAAGAAVTVPPGNLLSGSSADFEAGTGGWYSATAGVTLSTVSQPVEIGTGAMAVTDDSASGGVYIGSGSVAAGTATPAVPGARYMGSASVEAAGSGVPVSGVVVFYDATGTSVGSSWGQAVTDVTGGWVHVPATVGIAPANTAWTAFFLFIQNDQPGQVHYVDNAILDGSATTASVTGPLYTSGNRIYDASGPVVLRGLNRNGAEVSSTNFPTDAEIGHAAAWGATFMRLPLGESLWVNTCTASRPSNDPQYPSRVDAAVSSITSRHMVALLDLHTNVTSRCGALHQQAMADAQYAPGFWSSVAARYASNPLVAFDLYNEPHDISDAVWLSGGTASYGGVTFKAAGMQQLYSSVRRNAPSNLIFISGKDWANRPAATLVTGTNIVNAVHDYTCPGTPCTSTDPYDAAAIMQNWTTVGATQPVMLTEFGYPGTGDGTFNANAVAYAEQQGWGWSAFSWDGTNSGEFDLLNDVGTTYEPVPTGEPILAGLTCNGTATSMTSVAGTTWCQPPAA